MMKIRFHSALVLTLFVGSSKVVAFCPLQPRIALAKPARDTGSISSASRSFIRFATVPEEDAKIVEPKVGAIPQETDSVAKFFNKVKPSPFEGIPYSELTIGVLKEELEGENRVSQTPDTVRNLVKEGFTVIVESGGKLSKINFARTFYPHVEKLTRHEFFFVLVVGIQS